jgi:xylan 1,4-beta-xylosidase
VVTQRDGKRQVALRKTYAGRIVAPEEFHAVPDGDLILAVTAQPLEYHFTVQTSDGKTIQLGTARTRDLSTETLTAQPRANFNFTGVYIGLFATGTGQRSTVPADFDWFEYQPLDQ